MLGEPVDKLALPSLAQQQQPTPAAASNGQSWYQQQLAKMEEKRRKAQEEERIKKANAVPVVRVGARLRAARAKAAGVSEDGASPKTPGFIRRLAAASPKSPGFSLRRRNAASPKSPGFSLRRRNAASPKSPGFSLRRRLVEKRDPKSPKSPGAARRLLQTSLSALGAAGGGGARKPEAKSPTGLHSFLRRYNKKLIREQRAEDQFDSIMRGPAAAEGSAAKTADGDVPRHSARGHLLLNAHDSLKWCNLGAKDPRRAAVEEEKEVVVEEPPDFAVAGDGLAGDSGGDAESVAASSVTFAEPLDVANTNTSIVTVHTAVDADAATG